MNSIRLKEIIKKILANQHIIQESYAVEVMGYKLYDYDGAGQRFAVYRKNPQSKLISDGMEAVYGETGLECLGTVDDIMIDNGKPSYELIVSLIKRIKLLNLYPHFIKALMIVGGNDVTFPAAKGQRVNIDSLDCLFDASKNLVVAALATVRAFKEAPEAF